MGKQLVKDERIEIRVSTEVKNSFKKAQILSGDSSVSGFVVRVVTKEAKQIISDSKKIIASERDREKFFDAVFSDNEPNQNLKEAAKRFKRIKENGNHSTRENAQ